MMWMCWFATLVVLASGVCAAEAGEPVLLSSPDRVSTADRAVVLVHGLIGSARETFGEWPRIIMGDHSKLPGHGKLSDFAIYAVDYRETFKGLATLEDVAVGVAADLAASKIFKHHRHVWFVAHSMGGLVLKRTLALWKLRDKTVLIDRIIGIGYLGVPSKGSPVADYPVFKYFLRWIANWSGWNGDLILDLSTDSGKAYLGSLENDWMAIKATRDSGAQRRFTPKIFCGFETKRWLGIFLIVPKRFASSTCDVERSFSVTHTQLTKPNTAADSVHGWLTDLITTSIAAGAKEQRVSLTTAAPSRVLSYLSNRVDFSNQDLAPAKLDRAIGLPYHPERIEFADDKSKVLAGKLVLRGGPFYGSTKADLWEAVGNENSCLQVKKSPDRLVITLAIKDNFVQCLAGEALVCKGQSCD